MTLDCVADQIKGGLVNYKTNKGLIDLFSIVVYLAHSIRCQRSEDIRERLSYRYGNVTFK